MLRAGIAELWHAHLEPQAVAAGVPATRRLPRPPDAGQRPGRAGPDGPAHARRPGPDRRAGPAGRCRCWSSTARTTTLSPPPRRPWPSGWRPPALHPRGRALPRRRGTRHHGERADPVLGRRRGCADQDRPGQAPRRHANLRCRLSGRFLLGACLETSAVTAHISLLGLVDQADALDAPPAPPLRPPAPSRRRTHRPRAPGQIPASAPGQPRPVRPARRADLRPGHRRRRPRSTTQDSLTTPE